MALSTFPVLSHHHHHTFPKCGRPPKQKLYPFGSLLLRKAVPCSPASLRGPSLPQGLLFSSSLLPLILQVCLHAAGHHLCAGVHPGFQDYILWQLLVWALWLQPEPLPGEAGGMGASCWVGHFRVTGPRWTEQPWSQEFELQWICFLTV